MLHAVVTEDGQQWVLRDIPPYELPVVDLSTWSEDRREAHLLTTRQALEHRLFDLSVWPQFDVRIHHLPDDVPRLHIAIDGWCVDGWSYQVLFDDVRGSGCRLAAPRLRVSRLRPGLAGVGAHPDLRA